MRNPEKIRQAIERFLARLQRFGEEAFPEHHGDGLEPIRGPEDRKMIIRFMREVYHEGMSEQVWAAKFPAEYERIVRIAGTVPRKPEE